MTEMAIDTIWVLLAAFLVFLMQLGFAMVESGFTRAKNAGNIIMKNVMDFACGSLLYWSVGFALMFGVSRSGFIGGSGFFALGEFAHLDLNIPVPAFLLFQTMFAATAATIVSGAMAERTKFVSYLLYSVVITAVIYPVVGHWGWGGGWLEELGFVDFAGSTIVHSVGGWAALVGAAILGPRLGKFTSDKKPNAIPGHSITLGAMGVFILWFGWFGFNAGSTIAGMDLSIAHIVVTTNLAAAGGAVLAMAFSWIRYGKPDVSLTLNGALAGLVGITAGTADVDFMGAALIGAGAGVLIILAVEFIEKVLHVDDPVGAVAVHGVCGAYGTVMVGFFATDGGLFYGGGAALLSVQAIGVLAVAAWTMTTAFILFKAINAVVGLRVSAAEEEEGLDVGEHGMEAYADFVSKSSVPQVH
ncbi:ammonium transporter [Dethiobacter alkaliphilus]|uniref:Ammonium transporter n=1 Tax=Dethiobacter alkaliphilus AHT 1 TaxID=555088 RepID=C0GKN4_DETAL|nr:ammonium transporter [Dethiobacter alkaliphilus]EEG76126.1 ammonium transporter [Dethiobacter alkaliphilus AHT 1]